MGFHKRFVNLESILSRYKGDEDLRDIKQFINTDALIVELGSCQYIVDKLLNGDDFGALLIIKYELNR